MGDEFAQKSQEHITPSIEPQPLATKLDPQQVAERLGRMEAALNLVLDHLQSQTEGTQMLESQHSHSMLSSIALGFSAVALIALFTIATIYPVFATGVLRFAVGMAVMFLAAVFDLISASLLRRAVTRAMMAKDPSRLVFERGQWFHLFTPSYWARLRREVPDFYHHQVARYLSLAIYITALAFLIWAMIRL